MNTPMIREVAARQLADRTRADLYAAAEPLGMPLGMVQTPSVHGSPQTVAVLHSSTASPRRSGTSRPLRRLASASSDHHRRSFPPQRCCGGSRSRIRVVEFGVAAVVPECVWMLSELGAG